MAVNAHGNLGITLGKEISVNTGLVLAQLIGPQRGIVLAHEATIRVAAAAKLGDIFAPDTSAESGSLAHGIHVCFCGITTVATRAGQALLRVDVIRELLFCDLKRRIQCSVAIQAGVLRLRACHTYTGSDYQEQEQRPWKCVISTNIHR
jgi:hypothetical protein